MNEEIKKIEDTPQEETPQEKKETINNQEEKVTIPDWNIEPPIEIQRNKDEL